MPIVRDHGVVLARVDYSETSQVIVLFTREHGKVRAIAKGIKRGTKKRFAVGIDLLDVGQVVVSSRHERGAALATVIEWRQTRPFTGLREKLFRIHGAQYMVEITANLTEDWDPHIEMFDSLVLTLRELSEASEPLGPVSRYQLAFLESIGSLPRFESCVVCGRGEDLTVFSSFEGGMVCKHCEAGQVEKREVSPATLRTLRDLGNWADRAHPGANGASSGSEEASGEGVAAAGAHPSRRAERVAGELEVGPEYVGVFDVLDYHISHLMGRAPRMASKLISSQRRRTLG